MKCVHDSDEMKSFVRQIGIFCVCKTIRSLNTSTIRVGVGIDHGHCLSKCLILLSQKILQAFIMPSQSRPDSLLVTRDGLGHGNHFRACVHPNDEFGIVECLSKRSGADSDSTTKITDTGPTFVYFDPEFFRDHFPYILPTVGFHVDHLGRKRCHCCMDGPSKSHVSERVDIRTAPVFIHARNLRIEDFISKRWCIIFHSGLLDNRRLLGSVQESVLDGPLHDVLIAIGADTECIDNIICRRC
mmetsp:Transcript_22754/g.37504  ORF Transcript_22754/g.37504 Transcript_22754/m.37504 type:complete len:243 (+) Transcript_22754:2374-3102(+)